MQGRTWLLHAQGRCYRVSALPVPGSGCGRRLVFSRSRMEILTGVMIFRENAAASTVAGGVVASGHRPAGEPAARRPMPARALAGAASVDVHRRPSTGTGRSTVRGRLPPTQHGHRQERRPWMFTADRHRHRQEPPGALLRKPWRAFAATFLAVLSSFYFSSASFVSIWKHRCPETASLTPETAALIPETAALIPETAVLTPRHGQGRPRPCRAFRVRGW